MSSHLEDFTLLRFVVRELDPGGGSAASRHLRSCDACAGTLAQIRRVDSGLRALADANDLSEDPVFEAYDPFRRRPEPQADTRPTPELPLADVIAESRGADAVAASLLESLRFEDDLEAAVARLSFETPADRYGLLYALQEAGRRSAEYPLRVRDFAQEAVDVLRRRRRGAGGSDLAERLVPTLVLRGHAHNLLAIACQWTQEATRGRAHLVVAYRSFARAGADDVSLALVELAEATRRALVGEGATALALARRCRATFVEREMTDYAARATNAEALAHSALQQHEQAVRAFRDAQGVFEAHRLWANYVGALNGSATSLDRLGRTDESRRDYARALRRFSSREHRSWIGYLQTGLAETLFNAGRYREAASSALRAAVTFGVAGLRIQRLLALLLEIDCWVRHEDPQQALTRLESLRSELRERGTAHEATLRKLARAITGAKSTFERVSRQRRQIAESLSRTSELRRA